MEIRNEHRLTAVEDRAASNTKRIDAMERRQDDLEKLAVSVEKIALREENMEKDVKEIKGDIKTIKEKPAKKWDNLVNQIIALVVAAVGGFILAKFGL